MTGCPLTFSTGSLYLYGLERCFALAAKHGFDGIEVMVDERYDTREADYLRRLIDAHHIPIHSLHSPFPGASLPGWERGLIAPIERTVRLAEALGAAHVVMHLPDRVSRLHIANGKRRLRLLWLSTTGEIKAWMSSGGLRRLQEDTPVRICVENMPLKSLWLHRIFPRWNQQKLTWWNTLEQWPAVHDYLTLDTTHWATHGIDPLAAYRAGGSRIRHIHLSNFDRGEEHRLPHRGELDLAAFLRHLAAEEFDGQIVLELDPTSLQADNPAAVERNLAESVAFCREALRRP